LSKQPRPLECISLTVPENALEAYEAALSSVCETVGFFRDHSSGDWRLEGVRQVGAQPRRLTAALALAAAVSGVAATIERAPVAADGWLERTREAFPELLIGRAFAVRGTHLTGAAKPGRTALILDAGVAFGSGEHASTRGCLIALEGVARRARGSPGRRPGRILDLGTGSGILAMAAAKTLHRSVLATDIEPWAVRVSRENAKRNGVHRLVRSVLADGWHAAIVRGHGPYDLVLGNILARPLRKMARDLAMNLAPGGTAILAGLLRNQARDVLASHRRAGLVLRRMIDIEPWTTLVIRKPGFSIAPVSARTAPAKGDRT
jgi:ribosomal protein L11 methyltransferase